VLALLIGAAAYLLVNTVLVAGIVSLTSEQAPGQTLTSIFGLTYLYYVLSAAIAAVILGLGVRESLLLLTLVLVYGSLPLLPVVVTMSSLVPRMASAGD
jgi:hypothetical protein